MRKCEMSSGIIIGEGVCFWGAMLGRGRCQVKRRQPQVLVFYWNVVKCARAPGSLTPCPLALLQMPGSGDDVSRFMRQRDWPVCAELEMCIIFQPPKYGRKNAPQVLGPLGNERRRPIPCGHQCEQHGRLPMRLRN